MEQNSLNEFHNRLKIYKNIDGSYSALLNYILYTFFWKPFNIFNFKKIGLVNNNYVINGKLLKNPNIQMILQLQKNIKLNENLFVSKTKSQILNDLNKEKDEFKKWFYETIYCLFNIVNNSEYNVSDDVLFDFIYFKKHIIEDYFNNNDNVTPKQAALYFFNYMTTKQPKFK